MRKQNRYINTPQLGDRHFKLMIKLYTVSPSFLTDLSLLTGLIYTATDKDNYFSNLTDWPRSKKKKKKKDRISFSHLEIVPILFNHSFPPFSFFYMGSESKENHKTLNKSQLPLASLPAPFSRITHSGNPFWQLHACLFTSAAHRADKRLNSFTTHQEKCFSSPHQSTVTSATAKSTQVVSHGSCPQQT